MDKGTQYFSLALEAAMGCPSHSILSYSVRNHLKLPVHNSEDKATPRSLYSGFSRFSVFLKTLALEDAFALFSGMLGLFIGVASVTKQITPQSQESPAEGSFSTPPRPKAGHHVVWREYTDVDGSTHGEWVHVKVLRPAPERPEKVRPQSAETSPHRVQSPQRLKPPVECHHIGSFLRNPSDETSRHHFVMLSAEEYFAYVKWVESSRRRKKTNVKPQSSELKQATTSEETLSQNVKFIDAHPGYGITAGGDFDAIRDGPLSADASLDEFFSRPLKIWSKEWQVGVDLFQKINPWEEYFTNLRVINRISNYKLMRAKLHLKILINGNAFHYGRLLAAYNPLPTYDTLTVDRVYVDSDNVAASQRPHLYLDPTNSQGGEMTLPFFYHFNAVDITAEGWSDLGELTISTLTPLKHANGATDTVTVNVFAWATDVKFALPTHKEPSSISPQSDEYGKGIVSKPASVVANVASKLVSIPTIGPFARATEIGGRGVAAMATLFGYSRPTMLTKSQYRPHPKGDYSVTDGEDDVAKLSVTGKQELTIDPRTAGLSGTDELSINYIASRESYITDFQWAVGTAPETLLFNTVVDPGIHRKHNNELHFPACCFAVMPFTYWRGSMEFRFQVVCSKYHKGRLKVVYDPYGTPSASAEYNTAYTTVVDISDTTDFTIKCGWGQDTPYRRSVPLSFSQTGMFRTDAPLAYNAITNSFGNGTLSVYVVNELTVPNTEIDNDIEINVFVKACDDFEVASPDYDEISELRISDKDNITPLSDTIRPQSDEATGDVPNQADETDRMDSAPLGTRVVNTTGEELPLTDYTNHVYFGESIRSFRQLIKRYNLHEVLTFPGTWEEGDKIRCRYRRYMVPHEPGYTSDNNNTSAVTFNGFYYYAQMTLLKYLIFGFGGWRGGTRWLIDSSTVDGRSQVIATRSDEFLGLVSDAERILLNGTGTAATVTNLGRAHNDLDKFNGQNGCHVTNSEVNPVASFEVPYYSQFRFTPAKQRVRSGVGTFNFGTPTFSVNFTGKVNHDDFLTSWVAAAEDFNCFFFLGAPIFYQELQFPTT